MAEQHHPAAAAAATAGAAPAGTLPAAVRALPRVIGLLDERGLTSVGLDALLGDPTQPGPALASQKS